MAYIENPKTKGSGIMCAIPQTGTCPNKCADCFFQSGRSYLEPLDENLPNMPYKKGVATGDFIIRVNDGNDSNYDKQLVISESSLYQHKFFNTAIPDLDFPGPIVLTVNPGDMTDKDFHKIDKPPKNLMFVRVRVNAWNMYNKLVHKAVEFYTSREIPVILTFMAYHNIESIPEEWQHCYTYRKRTQNSYWAITTRVWRDFMDHFKQDYTHHFRDEKWVYSCGKIEGELGDTHCRFCGNCLREYFATIVRMEGVQDSK